MRERERESGWESSGSYIERERESGDVWFFNAAGFTCWTWKSGFDKLIFV